MIPNADASTVPGADALMIPDADDLAIPNDAPGRGYHLGVLLGIMVSLLSSSGTLLVPALEAAYVKLLHDSIGPSICVREVDTLIWGFCSIRGVRSRCALRELEQLGAGVSSLYATLFSSRFPQPPVKMWLSH